MEKEASIPSDPNSISSITLSTSPPPVSMLGPHSPPSVHTDNTQKKQQFSTDFVTLYHSIFPPSSPPSNTSTTTSPPPHSDNSKDVHQNASSNSSTTTTSDAERRLEQADLALEYENLHRRYNICRAHIQDLTNEINALKRENASLMVAKTELVKLLSLSSQNTLNGCMRRLNLIDSGSEFGGDELSTYTPTSVVDQSRFERTEPERVWLPKSISVRSSSYLKANQASNNSGSSRMPTDVRAATELDAGKVQQRMYLPGVKKELEVYSQGMFKTELCNKWQETGTCPYGDHCQFAHGIAELRPVIRHPRYKTEVCRMVLAGDSCPYGHRCHFRHSLTEQEMMLAAGAAPPR
ncbi:hypothetical protein SAY87_008605 [Trapa incisa]|uniref:C3H1-type domain-containing protein n=1 Tax=Trapa incisa TaxID=236973 RepID=A0AAN7PWE7_9MYRT|nr:hypothetical protein SAY87_008605 [Trapa incisa]